jgi:hypothetical protein
MSLEIKECAELGIINGETGMSPGRRQHIAGLALHLTAFCPCLPLSWSSSSASTYWSLLLIKLLRTCDIARASFWSKNT